jgi:hypothetical protein
LKTESKTENILIIKTELDKELDKVTMQITIKIVFATAIAG